MNVKKKKAGGYSKTNVTFICARGTPGCGGSLFSFYVTSGEFARLSIVRSLPNSRRGDDNT